MIYICGIEMLFRMTIKKKRAMDKEELINRYGIEVVDVRCKCGNKLCEVERNGEGVVRIKCRRCGEIMRIELTR